MLPDLVMDIIRHKILNSSAPSQIPMSMTHGPVTGVKPGATRVDLSESESLALNVLQRRRRVLGPAHPQTKESERALSFVRTGKQLKEACERSTS